MPTYGQTVKWRGSNGTLSVVRVNNCASAEEARSIAFRDATAFGWTPRKWWQWWRYGEESALIPSDFY